MYRLTVLSPHRDDAVFSLGGALRSWTEIASGVTVVNFFTRSSYAPRALKRDVSGISETRRREDLRAIRGVSRHIRVIDGRGLDAPLRLGIGLDRVTQRGTAERLPEGEKERLAGIIRHLAGKGLVTAPLAVGGHVDHEAVAAAAAKSVDRARLAFYEDLPYAIWTPPDQVRARVESLERDMRTALRPVIIKMSSSEIFGKFWMAAKYSSQIAREEAKQIARHAFVHGGERIWIAHSGTRWRALL